MCQLLNYTQRQFVYDEYLVDHYNQENFTQTVQNENAWIKHA